VRTFRRQACGASLAEEGTGEVPLEAPVSVIAVHGLADSAAEVDAFASYLVGAFPTAGVRWIFPRALARPVTFYGGRSALAWFDVYACNRSRVDENGIEEASACLARVIARERRDGVPAKRIVLAGFSQGGTLALHAGLQQAASIGGIIALSGALPFLERVPPPTTAPPPLFLAHGYFDTVVPYGLGRESKATLESRGYDVEWHGYPVGHWIMPRMLGDIANWLERRVLESPSHTSPRPSIGMPLRLLGLS
jgi:phospholipase/carboxylesterase